MSVSVNESKVMTALIEAEPMLEVSFVGEPVLRSHLDVSALAAGSLAAASIALQRLRQTIRSPRGSAGVQVDRRAADACFIPEQLFTPRGWATEPLWDPLAGNYPVQDGWIRLHTNYANHRRGALQALGLDADQGRESVAKAASGWRGEELEDAVVAAGGCAALMRTRSAWTAHPAGRSIDDEPLVAAVRRTASSDPLTERLADTRTEALPLAGLRVLDLTRVIAGPVCTRFLAAYGADVLRIDPPGFREVPALLPEMTLGKRCAALDLAQRSGRETFERLVVGADVLVCGLRPEALAGLGYDPQPLIDLNPNLIVASLDAYGWAGAWRDRRGFDSLVQMSCGIAADGAELSGRSEPVALPAQALDHGTGFILAAAVIEAVRLLVTTGLASELRCSLVRTAALLQTLSSESPPEAGPSPWSTQDTEGLMTAWGAADHAPLPATLEGLRPDWAVGPGPLGRHAAEWRRG